MVRNQEIDVFKGLLIILVVLGHSLQYGFGADYRYSELFYDDYLFRAIYTFHMPLFMFISGYLFRYSNRKPWKVVVLSRLKTIGVPFVTFCTLLYFIWHVGVKADAFYFSDYLRKMKVNMWFLSSALLNTLILSSVTRISITVLRYFVSFIVMISLFVISDDVIPAVHKFMFIYFALGYYFHFCKQSFSICLNRSWFMVILSMVFVLCVFIFDKRMFVYSGGMCMLNHGEIDAVQLFVDVLRVIIGVVASCWFVAVVRWFLVNQTLRWKISKLGKETLAIYGFQSVLFLVITILMEREGASVPKNYLLSIVLSALVIMMCCLLIKICNQSSCGRFFFLGK